MATPSFQDAADGVYYWHGTGAGYKKLADDASASAESTLKPPVRPSLKRMPSQLRSAVTAVRDVQRAKSAAERIAASTKTTIGELRRKAEKSKEIRVSENEWQSVRSAGVFFPVGYWRSRWDLLVLLLVMYCCVVDPFRFAFDVDAEGRWLIFELFVSLSFMADVAMNWSTAYLDEEGYWVIERRAIARNYATGWFWIDFPSSLPLELLPLLMHGEKPEDVPLKLLRVLRLLRLLRAVRLLKLDRVLIELAESIHLNLRILQLVRLLTIVIYVMHLLGCAWRVVAMASERETGSSWLQLAIETHYHRDHDGGRLDDHVEGDNAALASIDVWEEYVLCLLFSLAMLVRRRDFNLQPFRPPFNQGCCFRSGGARFDSCPWQLVIGYQDMPPTTNAERVLVIISLLGGTLVFGYVLSAVAGLLESIDALSSWKSERCGRQRSGTVGCNRLPYLHPLVAIATLQTVDLDREPSNTGSPRSRNI